MIKFLSLLIIGILISLLGATPSLAVQPSNLVTFPDFANPLRLVIDPVRDFNASGSAATTTGDVTAGSKKVTITGSSPTGLDQFKIGQGVCILGAGPLPTAAEPSEATVTPVGAFGSTTYEYAFASVDSKLGVTTCYNKTINNGNGSLSSTNYNALSGGHPYGANEIAVWRIRGGQAQGFIGILGLDFHDTGLPVITPPMNIPSTPPSQPIREILTSQINRITGSNSWTIANAPLVSVSGTTILHDDSTAIAKAVAANPSKIVFNGGSFNIFNPNAFPISAQNILFYGQNGTQLNLFGSFPTTFTNSEWQNITFSAPNCPHSSTIFSDHGDNHLLFQDCTIIDCSPDFLDGANSTMTDVAFIKCDFTQSSNPPSFVGATIGNVVENFYVIDCSFNHKVNPSTGTVIAANHNPHLKGNYWFIGNRFFNQNQPDYTCDAAIDIEPPLSTTTLTSVIIRNNLFYNSTVYISSTNKLSITNNYFRATSGVASHGFGNTNQGYFIFACSSNKSVIPSSDLVQISHNSMIQDVDSKATYYPCPVLIGNAPIGRLIINNNSIQVNEAGEHKGPAIHFGNTSSVSDFEAISNTITQTSPAPNAYLISFSLTPTNIVDSITVQGNKVSGRWLQFVHLRTSAPAMINLLDIKGNDVTSGIFTKFIGISHSLSYVQSIVEN